MVPACTLRSHAGEDALVKRCKRVPGHCSSAVIFLVRYRLLALSVAQMRVLVASRFLLLRGAASEKILGKALL